MFLPRADAIALATTGRCIAFGPDRDLKEARAQWEQYRILMTRGPILADALETLHQIARTALATDGERVRDLQNFFNRADIQALLLEIQHNGNGKETRG